MIIDATDLIAGRLGSFVAKKALQGEKIEIVNCGDAVITGSRSAILEHYKERWERGTPRWGPFFYKKEDRFLKRLIRGMLPYKQEKGRKAFERIRCYIGVPAEFNGKKFESVPGAHVSKMQNLKYMRVKEICEAFGG